MSDIRFWLGMTHRGATKRNDKLMIGNIETGEAAFIDVSELLAALTTDDLPEGLNRKYITAEQRVKLDNLASGLLTLQGAAEYFYPKNSNPAGYLNAQSEIPAGSITGILGTGNIPQISADKIVSGVLSAARIPGLDASKITSGTLSLDRIPMIPASKIESMAMELGNYLLKAAVGSVNGVAPLGPDARLSVGYLPNFDASKITSGIFSEERIPAVFIRQEQLNDYLLKSETEVFTLEEKIKLAGLADPKWKGGYPTKEALLLEYPEGEGQEWHNNEGGWEADVDGGPGQPVQRHIWDASDFQWVIGAGTGGTDTAATTKVKYESNPDTNAFQDHHKAKVEGLPAIVESTLGAQQKADAAEAAARAASIPLAQTENFVSKIATNLGKDGSVPSKVISSEIDWWKLPVGWGGMINVVNSQGCPPVTSPFGYFKKIANRDTGGGWSGIWMPYHNEKNMYIGYAETFNNYATWLQVPITTDIPEKGEILSKENVVLWKDKLESEDWVSTNWTLSSGFYYTEALGPANDLTLNRQLNIEQKTTLIRFKVSSDGLAVFRWKGKENQPLRNYAEIYVNANQGIFYFGDNTGTNTPHPSCIPANFTFIDGDEYQLETYRYRGSWTALLRNYRTSEEFTLEADFKSNLIVESDVFSTYLYSGTNLSVYGAQVSIKKANVIIYGDSITEGGQLLLSDENVRYSDYLVENLDNDCLISARSGGNINGVLEKIDTEMALLLPQYVLITIGTNSGNTYENLTELISRIKKLGITPILNHIPWRINDDSLARNQIIKQVATEQGIESVLFDLATSTNNTISAGRNEDLYPDVLNNHPNQLGHLAMYNRIRTDVPFLFQKNTGFKIFLEERLKELVKIGRSDYADNVSDLQIGEQVGDKTNVVSISKTVTTNEITNNALSILLKVIALDSNNAGRFSRAIKAVSQIDPNGFVMDNNGAGAVGIEARSEMRGVGIVKNLVGGYFSVTHNLNDAGSIVEFGTGAVIKYIEKPGIDSIVQNAVGIHIYEQSHTIAVNTANLYLGDIHSRYSWSGGNFSIFNSSVHPNYFEGSLGVGQKAPKAKLDVKGGVKIANDSSAAGLDKEGTFRYRNTGTESFLEMCMQTGINSYEWIIVKQNTW